MLSILAAFSAISQSNFYLTFLWEVSFSVDVKIPFVNDISFTEETAKQTCLSKVSVMQVRLWGLGWLQSLFLDPSAVQWENARCSANGSNFKETVTKPSVSKWQNICSSKLCSKLAFSFSAFTGPKPENSSTVWFNAIIQRVSSAFTSSSSRWVGACLKWGLYSLMPKHCSHHIWAIFPLSAVCKPRVEGNITATCVGGSHFEPN